MNEIINNIKSVVNRLCLIAFIAAFQSLPTRINGQEVFYQDIFCGSASVYGISSWDTTEILLNPAAGEINRVLLVSGQQNDDVLPNANYQKHIAINGTDFYFNNSTQVTRKFHAPYLQDSGSVHVIDVTPSIVTGLNSVITDLMSFPQGENVNQRYIGMSLVVLIEDTTKNKQAFCLWLNDQPIQRQINLDYEDLTPIDSSKDVLFSFSTAHFNGSNSASGLFDGSYLYINNDSIGLVTGQNEFNISTLGAILGQYKYENDTIHEVGDDFNDYFVSGSDCVANLKDNIPNKTTSMQTYFLYENTNPNHIGNYTNPVWTTYMSYTTPCDTFFTSVPNNVNICKGDTATINIVGGNFWEWSPQEGLSCYNCPNPQIIADSTMFYTVRIWNTDSCSKVLPVKINVLDLPPTPIATVANTLCSDTSGAVAVELINNSDQYSLDGGPLQNYRIFEDLMAGEHLVTVTDTNGCSSDTTVFVNTIYPTANFVPTPQQGDVPLEVSFSNQSTGHTHSVWHINGDTLYDESPVVVFNEGGVFENTLIVYDTYPQCADTVTQVIIAKYPFVVIVPSLHTDRHLPYQIYTTGVTEMTYQLYNEIGQLVISKALFPINGNNEIWNSYQLAKGTYIYRISAKDADGNEKEFTGKVVKM